MSYLSIKLFQNYSDAGAKKRPVIIHRAILGSLERFIAVITESFGGKWPFWLNPRQAMVVPIHSSMNEYAQKVAKQVKRLPKIYVSW